MHDVRRSEMGYGLTAKISSKKAVLGLLPDSQGHGHYSYKTNEAI